MLRDMKTSAVAILAALSLPFTATAERLLFTGQVQSITLQPSGVGQCSLPCGAPKTPVNGIRSVCVSNAGGCQNAAVKVLTDHLGGHNEGKVLEFASRTGEWGGLTFPNEPEPILVFAHEGQPRWLPLVERDGVSYVNVPEGQRPLSEFISEFQAQPVNSR
ncbi:hypothetical protein GTP41_24150 [Pseudoduganella sp. DS3]|uniref:Uncharacterized protein n=1 Tax=Pseudoduganella guangdongensis TaxID=2692179 RepID=A0A6N9HQR4_9BURK|nr:hypothetical protein [Pseudoduganella guangdongensis]MYN05192.1 hypothetical protein [Pseudoduganella guangdongensis]